MSNSDFSLYEKQYGGISLDDGKSHDLDGNIINPIMTPHGVVIVLTPTKKKKKKAK